MGYTCASPCMHSAKPEKTSVECSETPNQTFRITLFFSEKMSVPTADTQWAFS